MSVLKVAHLGHPILRATAQPVAKGELRSGRIQHLIDDMLETMHEYVGVGLAAPQVHERLRMALVEVPAVKDEGIEAAPLTILINPVVTPLGPEQVLGWEGCLSLPDLRGEVPRAARIKVEYLNRDGRQVVTEASGFFARVIQHECDHLDGIVFLDRMVDLKRLAFQREFERYVLETT